MFMPDLLGSEAAAEPAVDEAAAVAGLPAHFFDDDDDAALAAAAIPELDDWDDDDDGSDEDSVNASQLTGNLEVWCGTGRDVAGKRRQ